jgi:hypothetical protein
MERGAVTDSKWSGMPAIVPKRVRPAILDSGVRALS